MTATWLVVAALIANCVMFAALFWLARRINNYGIVDIAWSYSFGLLAIFYACTMNGWLPRRVLLATLAVVWSARLSTHLAIRITRHHPTEDTRYQQLRRDWAVHFPFKMFVFFQLQAASVIVLGASFLLAARNPSPEFHFLEIIAVFLWGFAWCGEALADWQLAAFKRAPENGNRVCDVGLWRYSRHPNYFFEWMIWVAFAVFALSSPFGWLGIVGPVSILWLLLRVTGIPMTEAQSLRSRGDDYRRYQNSTSAFLPLPRRRLAPATRS